MNIYSIDPFFLFPVDVHGDGREGRTCNTKGRIKYIFLDVDFPKFKSNILMQMNNKLKANV